MEQLVQILETQKGEITKIRVGDKTYEKGDDTHLGKIREFFTSGDVIWVGMIPKQEFKARLLLNPTNKK